SVEDHLNGLLVAGAHAVAEEKRRVARRGELGRPAPSAVARIITVLQLPAGALEDGAREEFLARGLPAGQLDQLAVHLRRGVQKLFAFGGPRGVNLVQHVEKTRPA